MRIAIRADASINQGTGHVMRCITLARSLQANGADVTLMSSIEGIPWLTNYVQASGIKMDDARHGSLDSTWPKWLSFDLVIVDSYEINAREISMLNEKVPVLALIDGDNRGISASIYLDQNLGSEVNAKKSLYASSLTLFGSRYALVRAEVLAARKQSVLPQMALENRKLLVFLGGTDPHNYVIEIANFLARTRIKSITYIAPKSSHYDILNLMRGRNCEVFEFTQELPKLIAQFDAVISASGTSAWDIATIGMPGGFLCVAENQQDSILSIERFGIGLNLGNLTNSAFSEAQFTSRVERLVYDDDLRTNIFKQCRTNFDGKGSVRVTEAVLTYLQAR